jgi:hypothetical protein
MKDSVHGNMVERRPEFSLPGHIFLVADLQEEAELLFKQRIIIFQLVSKQREGFYEGPAPHHHLCAALCNQVEGCKGLEHPDGIGRTEHRNGAG